MGTSTMPSPEKFLPENKFGMSPELRVFLDLAARDVNALGPQFSKEYKRLLAIGERLDAEAFRVAIVGPDGSGKSTLLNALFGESFLPTALDSLVAAPIEIQYGPEPQVRIWSQGKASVEEFSSISIEEFSALIFALSRKEDDFQHHQEMIVEILHPAPILRQGIVLVRAPGINPDLMSDWAATVDNLTGCDAVLFLVSSDVMSPEIQAN